MLRILEELAAGRQESMAELRTELSGLNRNLTAMFRGNRPGGGGPGVARNKGAGRREG